MPSCGSQQATDDEELPELSQLSSRLCAVCHNKLKVFNRTNNPNYQISEKIIMPIFFSIIKLIFCLVANIIFILGKMLSQGLSLKFIIVCD